jgi:hypothetical protein
MSVSNIPSVKFFRRGDRIPVQAQQMWLILVGVVMLTKKKIITYGDLAVAMGYPDRRSGHGLSRQLGLVGCYCIRNGLPTLNSIVINQETRAPGPDVVLSKGRKYKQYPLEQKEVRERDWFKIRVPTTGTFRKLHDSF